MKNKTTRTLFVAIAFSAGLLSAATATAALIDQGGGMIYDNDLNITWLKDANYAKTSGYDADGLMNWADAKAWAENLVYGGYSDWRLPTVTDTFLLGCDWSFGGTDCGYNVDTATGEMAHLFYDELGNKAYFDTSGSWPQPGWGLSNTGPFTNFQSDDYWSGTEYAPNSNKAWHFYAKLGYQGAGGTKDNLMFALAVRPGQVVAAPPGAVPEPATTWLLGLGLLGLAGVVRRRG